MAAPFRCTKCGQIGARGRLSAAADFRWTEWCVPCVRAFQQAIADYQTREAARKGWARGECPF